MAERFVVIKKFHDEGVCSIITKDSESGRLSYRLCKTYRKPGGEVQETQFFNLRHGAAIRRIMAVTEEYIMSARERELSKELQEAER